MPKRTWVRALALAALVGIPLAAHADDAIRVYYDGRDCGTDAIEVEVFDQGSGDWRPHPLHPSVPVDSCQTEDAGRLWNALRWRCPAPPSDRITGWRPVQVFDASVMSSCAEDRLGSERSRTTITVVSPADGATVRAREPWIELRGTVDVDGLAGHDYDVVLLVDRAAPDHAFAAQIAAARAFVRDLRPRLGPVRIAVLSFPSDASRGARRELAWSTDPRALDHALAGLSQRALMSRNPVASALDAALRELGSARSSARAMIVMSVDGARLDTTDEPASDDPLLRATARVAARGAVLHWVALGGLVPEDPALVRRALEHTRGTFRRVLPRSFATPFFATIALPVAQEVWVETARGAGTPEVPAALEADGAFRARIPLVRGANTLVIHARTSDGAVLGRRLGLTFDDSLVPEGARVPQRKEIEIRPER